MCSSSNEWYSTVLSEIKKKKAALGNVLLAWFNRSRSWKLVWLSDSDLLCVYDWNFYYLKWVTKITQWLMTQQLPNPTEGKKATLRADCQIFFTQHYNVMFIHAFFHSNFSNNKKVACVISQIYFFTESIPNKIVVVTKSALANGDISQDFTYYIPNYILHTKSIKIWWVGQLIYVALFQWQLHILMHKTLHSCLSLNQNTVRIKQASN